MSLHNNHVWQLTKTAVTSLKKGLWTEHRILEYNPIYITLYVARVIHHTFIWPLQTNTLTQNKYCAYLNIRLSLPSQSSVFRNDILKLVYNYKAKHPFFWQCIEKEILILHSGEFGNFIFAGKKESHIYYYWSNIMQELHESQS